MKRYLIFLIFISLNAYSIEFTSCNKNKDWLKKQLEKIERVAAERDVSRFVVSINNVASTAGCPASVVDRIRQRSEQLKITGLKNHINFMKAEARLVAASYREPTYEIDEIKRARDALQALGQTNIPADLSASEKRTLMENGSRKGAARSRTCTSVDNRKPPIAVLRDGKVVKNIMRDQDSIGWCYAYTAADMISQRTGKLASAIDLANCYNESSWSDFWETNESEMEGGYITEAANCVKKKGYCLEKNLPSCDFRFADNAGPFVKQLQGIESLYNSYYEKTTVPGRLYGRNKKTGQALTTAEQEFEATICTNTQQNVQALFPGLTVDSLVDIMGKSFSANDYMDRLVADSCNPRTTWPSNLSFSAYGMGIFDSKETMMSKMDKALTAGDLVGISYKADFLYDLHDRTAGNHASSVVARKFNSETNTCEYLIRNSWGTSCNYADKRIKCEEGNLWVSEEYISRSMYGVSHAQ